MISKRTESGIILIIFVLLIARNASFGQQPDLKILSTTSSKDSVSYTHFKEKMYKRRVTKELYQLLFRDIYNSNSNGTVTQIEENPFEKYRGKTIRKIGVKVLDANGFSVYDTLRKPSSKLEKIANNIHTTTQEKVVREQFLLFKTGDSVDPQLLVDNERILRATKIFNDARILIDVDKTDSQTVDIVVVVQDVWSLVPYLDYGSLKRFILGFDQINYKGLGHTFYAHVGYQTEFPDKQRYGLYTGYYIPSIVPKSYISSSVSFVSAYNQQMFDVNISRSFIRPETKWAGGVQFNVAKDLTEKYGTNDSLYKYNLGTAFADFWVGRTFAIGSTASNRLYVAMRKRAINYYKVPTELDNGLYQDVNQTLLSFGYSSRKYQRDVLIYGFGRTEDVPIGFLGSIVIGGDKAELGSRKYYSLNVSKGAYLPKKYGYLNTTLNLGTYIKHDSIGQNQLDAGVLHIEANYFSELKKAFKKTDWYWRHFVSLYYTKGYNRYNLEYIVMNGLEKGFRGIAMQGLRGTERLVCSLESVVFSPISIVGFRLANFVFADFGKITDPTKGSLASSPIYYGFGAGSRLRNENLAFTDLQIKIGYYPKIPYQNKALIFEIGTIIPLRFRDFNVVAPDVLQFR